MTGVAFRFDVDDAIAAAALDRVIARAEDLSPAHDDIGASMVVSTQTRFETGVGPDGVPWQPSLRARLEGGLTLVDKSILKNSITHVAGGDFAEWGTNVIYSAIHQQGGTIAAKDAERLAFALPGGLGLRRPTEVEIPARPFLGIDAGDRLVIGLIYQDHLFGDLR